MLKVFHLPPASIWLACSFTNVPSRKCDDADADADADDDDDDDDYDYDDDDDDDGDDVVDDNADHDDPTHSSPGSTTNQDLVCCTSAIISCEKGGQWQQALNLFDAMQLSDLQLDAG